MATVAATVEDRVAAIRVAVGRRSLTAADLATRVGCHPKTIRRLLEGRTRNVRLVDQLCRVLGLGDTRPKMSENVRSGPVTTWNEVAAILGVTPRTLHRWRRRHGDTRRRPWFASAADCQEWGRGQGGR